MKAAKLPSRPKPYRLGRVPGTGEIVIRPNYIVVYAESARAVIILRILRAAAMASDGALAALRSFADPTKRATATTQKIWVNRQ